MSPRDRVYVEQMLDMTTKSIEKIRGLTREQFDSDENLRLALVCLIQIIGEAASRVSSSYRDEHPDVPWSESSACATRWSMTTLVLTKTLSGVLRFRRRFRYAT